MQPTKDSGAVRRKAIELRDNMIHFFKRELEGFGNLADQLRVMGYVGEAMISMAETELALLKAQDAEAAKKIFS